MLTKEEIRQARNKGQSIPMGMHDFCDMCDKSDYGTVMLVKIPEGFTECLSCAEKYPDDKQYKGVEGGRSIYIIGSGFI